MKQLPLFFFLILISFLNSSVGQVVPNIEIPKLKPTFYETLKTDYLIKTTKNYQLHGNVKCIIETITKKEVGQLPVLAKTIHYEFLKNNQLSLYKEDTLKSLKHSNATIEKYFYDELGSQLLKIETLNGAPQNASKTIKIIDSSGNINQEIYERYESNSQYNNDATMFNYTLNYIWNKAHDSVQLKYNYQIPKTSYERFSDRLISFVAEIKLKKDTTAKNKNPKKEKPQYFDFKYDDITYDNNGNIIKWLNVDNTIKNSYNIDLLDEYKYNSKNELTEITHLASGMEGKGKFYLIDHYKIEYLQYDTNGNWTLKKVVDNHNTEYTYKRELFYY